MVSGCGVGGFGIGFGFSVFVDRFGVCGIVPVWWGLLNASGLCLVPELCFGFIAEGGWAGCGFLFGLVRVCAVVMCCGGFRLFSVFVVGVVLTSLWWWRFLSSLFLGFCVVLRGGSCAGLLVIWL